MAISRVGNAPARHRIFRHGVAARCPRGRASRFSRVGKIARRRAIMIAVPGNFAHPTEGFIASILYRRTLPSAPIFTP
jgi:hypothetical protein